MPGIILIFAQTLEVMLEIVLLVLLPLMVLIVMVKDRKVSKERGKKLGSEELNYRNVTPGVDHKAIARKLYDWLKARNSGKAISTRFALEKVFGRPRAEYAEDGSGYAMVYPDFKLVDFDIYQIDECLTDLIDREGEYEVDYPMKEDISNKETYDIPFVLKKKPRN